MGRLGAWVDAIYRAEPSPEQTEARRLGAALRLVVDRLVSTDATAEELAAATSQVERVAEMLSSFDHGGLYRGLTESRAREDGFPHAFFDFAPLLGRSNPIAPPLRIEVGDGQVIGRAWFGHAYEGPPGCVHGGFVAACFDDVLGMLQVVSDDMAMTGTLAVRYLVPTPLHTELRFVGRLTGFQGGEVQTRGELWAGGVRTAEAEALFITVSRPRFHAPTMGKRTGAGQAGPGSPGGLGSGPDASS